MDNKQSSLKERNVFNENAFDVDNSPMNENINNNENNSDDKNNGNNNSSHHNSTKNRSSSSLSSVSMSFPRNDGGDDGAHWLRRCCQGLRLKNLVAAFSLTPKGATPLRWNVVLTCAFCMFNAVLHMTVFFPFQSDMLIYFGIKEDQVGKLLLKSRFVGYRADEAYSL